MHRRRPTLFASAIVSSLVLGSMWLTAPTATSNPLTTVDTLQTNAAVDPLGIPTAAPKLGWRLHSDARGTLQSAYQVRVASTKDRLGDPDVWDSGKVDSNASTEVKYAGPALTATTGYVWQVRVWDQAGNASEWSAPATFETGLGADGWSEAEWIGADSQLPQTWRDSTFRFTASSISGALGVYLRGADGANAYMWQISESSRSLRPHIKVNGGYTVLAAKAFPAGFNFAAEHEYSFTVQGNTVTTSVDGTVLDTRTVTNFAGPGLVGFRTSGAESGVVSGATVTSSSGETLLTTTFPAGDRTFTGGTVTQGTLKVSGETDAWYAFGSEVPILRTEIPIAKQVASARVYASARGIYELRLNGERVGDHELAPGWTDYRARIAYQTYDVTDQVVTGDNAFSAELANGWYTGRVAMFGDDIYGPDTSLIAQLRVTYTDGTTETIGTDGAWKTEPGPTVSADLLDGEAFDARRAAELGEWDEAGYDDEAWTPVAVRPEPKNTLEPEIGPPVRVTEELTGTRMQDPAPGAFVYDLGQNMVGRTRVTLTGAPNTTVRLRVAEVLNPDGTLYTDNFRSAKATDYLTFGDEGTVTWEPKFTFHGFRYVELTGLDVAPAAADVIGVVVGTDNEMTGHLTTSSALVNQLQSNILWGQRGNFLSIPTDTPARDERMGWTGDINVFTNTANYNMDSQQFLTKWLQDLRDTQNAAGAFPGVAPIVPGRFDGGYGSAGWADAGVHVPYSLWKAYGDIDAIHDNYDAMRRFVDYLDSTSNNHIRNVGGYNDWLNLDDDTPVAVVDTAFVAKSTREFAEMAAAIGKTQDAASYQARYEQIKQAYAAAFISADGTVRGDSQTAYILTITNDLIPEGMADKVTARFVKTLERRDYHLSTGFLGVDGLLPALTKVGRSDIAYRLLQNTDYPSWGYEIGKGATTIWERWNSIMPDGSFGPVGMNSFNHYAYGAVGEWMYRTMAGVSALEPGYSSILIAPTPGAGIDQVDYTLDSSYGAIRSAWATDADGVMSLDVEIPANTTAEVRIPAPSAWAIREGGVPARGVDGVTFDRYEHGHAVFTVGSGTYAFTIDEALGLLGDARASVAELTSTIQELKAAGSLTADQARMITRLVAKFEKKIDAAWSSYVEGTGPSAGVRASVTAHQALSELQTLSSWVTTAAQGGTLGTDAAERLTAVIAPQIQGLSRVSALFVGAGVLVEVPAGVYPGDTAEVTVVASVDGDKPVHDPAATLTSADGWTVTRKGTGPTGAVKPGKEARFVFEVAVPDDAQPGAYRLGGTATYRFNGTSVSLPLSAELIVAAPVTVTSLALNPASTTPGAEVGFTAVVQNDTAVPRAGTLVVEGPKGWDAVEVPYSAPVGTSEVTGTVAVPLSVTAGATTLTARTWSTSPQASAKLTVAITVPPAGALDHVDLGEPASEQAHALAASPRSGTSVEAGLTRRYTHAQYPGGWFEFDVAVPVDGKFVVQVVETFDSANTKTYTVTADGVTVLNQELTRTVGGAGTMTYQFLVDQPSVSADGKVRLRFQDVEGGYDPSIADVWIVPVG